MDLLTIDFTKGFAKNFINYQYKEIIDHNALISYFIKLLKVISQKVVKSENNRRSQYLVYVDNHYFISNIRSDTIEKGNYNEDISNPIPLIAIKGIITLVYRFNIISNKYVLLYSIKITDRKPIWIRIFRNISFLSEENCEVIFNCSGSISEFILRKGDNYESVDQIPEKYLNYYNSFPKIKEHTLSLNKKHTLALNKEPSTIKVTKLKESISKPIAQSWFNFWDNKEIKSALNKEPSTCKAIKLKASISKPIDQSWFNFWNNKEIKSALNKEPKTQDRFNYWDNEEHILALNKKYQ